MRAGPICSDIADLLHVYLYFSGDIGDIATYVSRKCRTFCTFHINTITYNIRTLIGWMTYQIRCDELFFALLN